MSVSGPWTEDKSPGVQHCSLRPEERGNLAIPPMFGEVNKSSMRMG